MIYLCDFEDSFTFNIYTEVLMQGLQIEVIPHKKVPAFLENLIHAHEKKIVILGPGPGHPSEYLKVKEVLPSLMENKNVFIFGICLGHQLLCEAMGLKVERSLAPKHGESVSLSLNSQMAKEFSLPNKISVQRYNSLSVLQNAEIEKILSFLKLKSVFYQKELMMLKGERFISYQFHPESVGTSYRSRFFRALHNL